MHQVLKVTKMSRTAVPTSLCLGLESVGIVGSTLFAQQSKEPKPQQDREKELEDSKRNLFCRNSRLLNLMVMIQSVYIHAMSGYTCICKDVKKRFITSPYM